ncbi:MAG: hypothetical protein H6R18_1252 [Proteobacteria bacterium]|nr:hypothetical protein [Pseudomonadota bacterium]
MFPVNDLWYILIAFWAIVSAWATIEGLKC